MQGESPLELAGEASARRPDAAGPHLARGLYLAARYHARKSPPPDPEDLEAGADAALHGADLAFGAPMAFAFAADLLLEAGDRRDAEALLAIARGLEPENRYVLFQLARAAGARGELGPALELLRRAGRPDELGEAGYTFAKDPCLRGLLEQQAFKDYLKAR